MADESLMLGVDPRPAEEGFRRYDEAAERSIQKTQQLGQAISAYPRGMQDRLNASDIASATAEYDRLHQSVADAHAEAIRMNEAMASTATTSERSVQGIGRLNSTLASMARQAAGVHPVVGQLANVVGTFALGTATTTAVLAGLAAVGFAIRKITEDARESRDALAEARDRLRELVPAPTQNVQDVARLQARQALLVASLRSPFGGGGGQREEWLRELRGINEELAAGRRAVAGEMFEGPLFDGIYQRERIRREEEERRRIANNNADIALVRIRNQEATANMMTQRGWFEGRPGMGTALPPTLDETVDRFSDRLGKRKAEIDAWFEYQRDKENELADARQRANSALVASLANVGRAYGGVADQVLNLVGATLSLSRMPGFGSGETATLGDMARGYGTAALTGIGFGVSSGDPYLGGAGGAAAGFAMAGPGGAIVGGVAGIISGLVEQGERAARAQAQWERTFRGFGEMFDRFTPLESDMRAATEFFNQLVQATAAKEGVAFGGYVESPEDARRLADMLSDAPGSIGEFGRALEALIPIWETNIEKAEALRAAEEARFGEDLGVRALRAQGQDKEAERLELQLRQQREYEAALEAGYDKVTLSQLKYVQGLEAERFEKELLADTIRDVTSALNAPSGLRLSLYRWMGSGAVAGDDYVGNPFQNDVVREPLGRLPNQGTVTINIYEASNPRDAARLVMDALRQQARLGGPNPLLLETM